VLHLITREKISSLLAAAAGDDVKASLRASETAILTERERRARLRDSLAAVRHLDTLTSDLLF